MPIYKMDGKKDGRQQYRVRINYIDQHGKAKQIDRVAYGNAEAKALERQLTAELKHSGSPTATITVQQLYDLYVDKKRFEVRATSLDKSCSILIRDVLPTLGDKRIDKLTTPVLQKWKNGISESERNLSATTKKNIYTEFRALLNFAVRSELLPKNPLDRVGNFKDVYFEHVTEKVHYYTADDFKKFIAVARLRADTLTDWGYYVFFNIAFFTGMRKGEINALKWSDIDGDLLHVRRSIAQKIKGGDIETPPKNKSSYRTLQMPFPLLQVLQQHHDRHRACDGYSDDWRVCGGIACLRDTSMGNKKNQFAKEAGLDLIRIHDFRHSHATLLANEGINIQEISRRLGHSNIEITWNTYSHLYPREEEKAVQILNKIV